MSKGLRPKNQLDKKNFQNQYFEMHHVLPKSIFPSWKYKSKNIVALTAREHFFCHQLLIKIYPCKETKIALWYLMHDKQNNSCSSKEYQKLKLDLINSGCFCTFKGKKHTEESKKRMREKSIGRHLSEETKKKLSILNSGKNNPHYGKHLSDETKKKISDSNKGKTWKMTDEQRKKNLERIKVSHQKSVRTRILNNNYKVSDETKEKIRKYFLENNHMAKKIKCIELNTVFLSIQHCIRYFKNIGKVINKKTLMKYVNTGEMYPRTSFTFETV